MAKLIPVGKEQHRYIKYLKTKKNQRLNGKPKETIETIINKIIDEYKKNV